MSENKFIPALTGIRAVCVYLIFFKHLNFFSPENQSDAYLAVNQFFSFLSFFFVLSGLVIYYKYDEISSLNRTRLYNYFVNRVSRVFPILIILVTITFILIYRDGQYSLPETIKLYLLNITLLKGFSSDYHLTGIGPTWTLSVEELFYLLSPFIFLFAKNLSSLIKIVLCFYIAGLLISWIFSTYPIEGYFSSFRFTMYTTFFGRAFEFACGIYLGMILKGCVSGDFLRRIGRYNLHLGLFLILLSLILLYLIAKNYQIDTAVDTWPGIIVNNILLPIGIMMFFYSLLFYKSYIQRFLATSIMVRLGNATYSFYLLHTSFVLSLIFKYLTNNIFLTFFIMIIISVIFHRLVEQPLASFLRKKLSRRETSKIKM